MLLKRDELGNGGELGVSVKWIIALGTVVGVVEFLYLTGGEFWLMPVAGATSFAGFGKIETVL